MFNRSSNTKGYVMGAFIGTLLGAATAAFFKTSYSRKIKRELMKSVHAGEKMMHGFKKASVKRKIKQAINKRKIKHAIKKNFHEVAQTLNLEKQVVKKRVKRKAKRVVKRRHLARKAKRHAKRRAKNVA